MYIRVGFKLTMELKMTFASAPGPPLHSSSSHSSSPLPLFQEDTLTHILDLHPPWGLKSLEDQAHILPVRQDQAILCYMCVRVLQPALACCLAGGSVSGSFQASILVDTTGIPMGSLFPSASSILPLIHHRGLDFSPISRYKYLQLNHSAAFWASRRPNNARLLSVSTPLHQ